MNFSHIFDRGVIRMQPGVMQKKDKTGIIICTRCHAENLTSQTACGRCGFVFPKGTQKKNGKPDTGAFGPPGMKAVPSASANAQSSNLSAIPGMLEFSDREGGSDDDANSPALDVKPKRPKTLPEKGATEGIHKEVGQNVHCPRCGADLKAGVTRCPRCGFKQN